MSKKVLVATQKPFAGQAVENMRDICRQAGYDLKLLEKYDGKEQLLEALDGMDGLIVRSDKIDADIIDQAPDLKIIVRGGAGFDNVDIDHARERDIVVMNTPGQNANAVAELAVGMMLYSARNHFQPAPGVELKDKTLGLHAFGNVAQCLARITRGFGMTLHAYDPYIDKGIMEQEGVKPANTLSLLYQNCRYVSLHIPANETTQKCVNYDLLSQMPEGAVLVNTARKEVLCEDSLLKIFRERSDFHYVTDIAPDIHDQLASEFSGRYYATPKKMGAQTREANINAATAAMHQIVGYFERGDSTFQVNR